MHRQAPLVQEGQYAFHGIFLAAPDGEPPHIPRVPPNLIARYLPPNEKKAPLREYRAQLILYGLPDTMDIEIARQRLWSNITLTEIKEAESLTLIHNVGANNVPDRAQFSPGQINSSGRNGKPNATAMPPSNISQRPFRLGTPQLPPPLKRKLRNDDTPRRVGKPVKISKLTNARALPKDLQYILDCSEAGSVEEPESGKSRESLGQIALVQTMRPIFSEALSNIEDDMEVFPVMKRPLTGTYFSMISSTVKVGRLFSHLRFDFKMAKSPKSDVWWVVFRQCVLFTEDRRSYAKPNPVCDVILRLPTGPQSETDLDEPLHLLWKLLELKDGTVHKGPGLITFRKRGDVFVQLYDVPATAEASHVPLTFYATRKIGAGLLGSWQEAWDQLDEWGT